MIQILETTLDQALKLAKYTTNFTSARVSLVDSILFANLQTLHRKIDIQILVVNFLIT